MLQTKRILPECSGTDAETARLTRTASPLLSVELIPRTAWGRNVRAVVANDTWDALRWHLGATQFRPRFLNINFPGPPFDTKMKCSICGTKRKKLELHEEWHFDDKRQVQRLIGLKPVCSKCHLSKHLGYANIIGRMDEALAHLATVNGWTAREVTAYSDEAFAVCQQRSGLTYLLNLDYLTRYIPTSKIHLDWLDNPRSWVSSRLDAIVWATRLLDSDALILDTETTGLLKKSNVETVELAVINMRGKVVYQSLFRPRYMIPRRVIEIHGIRNEDVKDAPTFAQQAEQIGRTLHGKTLVTFNARFDRQIVARTCKLHKLEIPSSRWECAMLAYRTFSGSGSLLRLPSGSHRALADCRATLKLIRRMARSRAL